MAQLQHRLGVVGYRAQLLRACAEAGFSVERWLDEDDLAERTARNAIFPDAYCPKCGQKLSGNSKTGFKQAFYTHPFTPAITLGKPGELKGKRLRAPVARMEIVD